MAFNFGAAEKASLDELKNGNLLQLMLLGQSGSGKSRAIGTLGVKTLMLYGGGESHGPASAKKPGGQIVAVSWDTDDDGTDIKTPDAKFKRLLDALTALPEIKAAGFGAVVVDGATELEVLIRSTNRFKDLCMTDKGKHNSFAEGTAVGVMFRQVTDALRKLQSVLGLHYVVTCLLDVKSISDAGEIQEAAPRLSTYGVCDGLLPQFQDRVAIGRMSKNDKIDHRLQFLAGVTKTSKDANGQVKKLINFAPRLGNLDASELPTTLAADLAKLARVKAGEKA